MMDAILLKRLLDREIVLAEANCVAGRDDSGTEPHLHASRMHVIYVESGEGQAIVNGRDDKLVPGTIHTVFPKERHQYIWHGAAGPYRIYFIHLDWFCQAPDFPRSTTLDEAKRARVQPLFNSMFQLFHYFHGRTKDCRMTGLFLELIAELTELGEAQAGADGLKSCDSAFFMDVLTLLQTPPFAFPGIDRLAKIKNMSRRNFTRLFRDETGLSVRDYFLKARMSYARHLSRQDFSQKEIAAQCGYANTQNFQRAYKSYMTCTYK